MTEIATRAAQVLRRANVACESGLSEAELGRIEADGLFEFNPDHREFLRLCLPVGSSWPRWRDATQADIQNWLVWPIDGVLFDVAQNQFWAADWGAKPTNEAEQMEVARLNLGHVPKLIPIYAHRYCVAAPAPSGSPVFSVHQTDTIYYGRDLADYFGNEFARHPQSVAGVDVQIPFWSSLAD